MRWSICIVLFLIGSISAASAATIPLVNVNPQALPLPAANGILPAQNESRGWAFRLVNPTRLEYVGWFDKNQDGLSNSHRVGIWRNTLGSSSFPHLAVNEFVADFTIPAGTAAELSGPWRRIPAGSMVLQPGRYQIVGENHVGSADDLVFWGPNSVIPAHSNFIASGTSLQGMSFGQPNFGSIVEGGWLPPDANFSSPHLALMGPMLFITEIPEPGTISLTVLVCGGVLCLRRKRIKLNAATAGS